MTYEQSIEYLYSHLPMFTRIGAAAYKKDISNTIALCKALGNPEKRIKTIHIAGTNGKGSTSHMLAAILQEAGYKTGLYTSPHLYDFGERIRINGEMINQDFVIDFVEKTKPLCASIEPSFFELTVAMAFEYFADEKVDIAVIETGLGGRLDSTNVITPEISIITNIGYDHMNLLGNTLPEIAAEKAGIIKTGVPVVIGESIAATMPVFLNKAESVDAPIYFAETSFQVSFNNDAENTHKTCTAVNLHNKNSIILNPDLKGAYQQKNIRTVLTAVELLKEKGYAVSDEIIRKALSKVSLLTGLHGRWEIIQQQPAIILDVAHNEDGIRMILQQLNAEYPGSKLHFILGFVKDKDVEHVLSLFPKNADYYFCNAHIPRALPYKELMQLAFTKGLKGNGYDDVNEALKVAKLTAKDNDVIMICGSFFTIAELKR